MWRRAEGRRGTADGWIAGETDEGENAFESTVIIDWALRTSNRWVDGGGASSEG